jgi:hypothetical protein
MVRAHDLRLANREVATEALVAEILEQLLAQIRAGSLVRIV